MVCPSKSVVELNFPGSVENGRLIPEIVNWYLNHHKGFGCPETHDRKNRFFRGGEQIAIPFRDNVQNSVVQHKLTTDPNVNAIASHWNRRYGTLYDNGVPGGPPIMPPGPFTEVTMSSYAYRQDRVISWSWHGPREGPILAFLAMDALQRDPNRFSPFQVLGHNGEREIGLGSTYDLVNRPDVSALPPGRFPVRVTEVTPTSFKFTTLPGHFDPPGSTITFSTRSDTAGAIRLEHLGVTTRARDPSIIYMLAPAGAGTAWDAQAQAPRQWLMVGH